MIDYIHISTLNDFIFCPYSIYLHNVYMSTEQELYQAAPQVRGSLAHEATDHKTSSTQKDDILALPVFSERFHLMGKIDLYKQKEKKLIERKYQLKKIYQGQIYQLWAQYFCLKEMGYEVLLLSTKFLPTKRFQYPCQPSRMNYTLRPSSTNSSTTNHRKSLPPIRINVSTASIVIYVTKQT
ncbi:MAG: type V CRISPR-associated protein Cas4 [Porphyromonas sp.]|nr:type V CRISPR-associated protein Cas4 [Porphyromonas sp.]